MANLTLVDNVTVAGSDSYTIPEFPFAGTRRVRLFVVQSYSDLSDNPGLQMAILPKLAPANDSNFLTATNDPNTVDQPILSTPTVPDEPTITPIRLKEEDEFDLADIVFTNPSSKAAILSVYQQQG